MALRPQMPAIGGVDELGGDAHAISGATDTAFQHRTDPELAAVMPKRRVGAGLVRRHHAGTPDHVSSENRRKPAIAGLCHRSLGAFAKHETST